SPLIPGYPISAAPPGTDPDRIFEALVSISIAGLWGPSGRAIRFGWPSDEGRPHDFNEAIRRLAQKIGVSVGSGYRQPRRKDGGVDVVAWRPFNDSRSGFPIVLVQCTLQENVLAKGSDIDVRLWGSWLALDSDPVTAIAIPRTLRSGTVWDELALRHLVLDRIRLVELGMGPLPESALAWVQEGLSIVESEVDGA